MSELSREKAISILNLLESDFCESDRQMKIEALYCEFDKDEQQIKALEAKSEKYKAALEDITKHIDIVGGGMSRYSIARAIAQRALE